MDDQPGQKVYDEEERARIVRALKRYAAEAGIGAPNLLHFVIKADQPRHRVISLSTLQRFLAGNPKVTNSNVDICASLARTLPWYDEEAELAHLGKTLGVFLGVPDSDMDAESLGGLAEGDYRGTSSQVRMITADAPLQPLASTLKLKRLGKTRFFRAAETIKAHGEHVHKYEGVLIAGDPYYLLLRDVATRQPRTLHLRRPSGAESSFRLQGQGLESSEPTIVPPGDAQDSFEIAYKLLGLREGATA